MKNIKAKILAIALLALFAFSISMLAFVRANTRGHSLLKDGSTEPTMSMYKMQAE